MSTITLSTNSTTLVLNGRAINDFVDGDTLIFTSVNPRTTHTRSSQSVNIQEHSGNEVYDVTVRLPKYSDDELWLAGEMQRRPIVTFSGSCKEVYVKDGIERITSWTMEQGSIGAQATETKNNVDGNNLMEYVIRFNRARRN